MSKTGKRGESWLESRQWCLNDPYGLWEKGSEETTTGSRCALQQCSKCSNELLAVSDDTTSPFSWSMRCILNHNLTTGQRLQVRDPRILSLP